MEWRLHLDVASRVISAYKEVPDGNARLAEAIERLTRGKRIRDLDPSLAAALDAASAYGSSGRRIVLVPYQLSQPIPVWMEADWHPDTGGHEVRLKAMADSTVGLDDLTSLSPLDLLLLSASLSTQAPPSASAVADRLMPVLLEVAGAEFGSVFLGGGRFGDLRLLGQYGAGRLDLEVQISSAELAGLVSGSPRGRFLSLTTRDVPSRLRVHGRRRVHHLLAAFGDDPSAAVWLACALDVPTTAIVPMHHLASLLGLTLVSRARQAHIERGLEDLDKAFSVTRAISESLDLDSKFHEIATSAADAIEGTSCLFLELHREDASLSAIASSDETCAAGGFRFRFEDVGDAEQMLQQKTAIAIQDLRGDYGVAPGLHSALSMQSAVFVPVNAHNHPIGALLLFSRVPDRTFAQDELRMVDHIADQAANAIENAQLYRDLQQSQARTRALLDRVSSVREQERSDAATIVHDEITQCMVGAVYVLESLSKRVAEAEREELRTTIEHLREATGRSRDVIRTLRHSALNEADPAVALKELARESLQGTDIRCVIKSTGGPLPSAAAGRRLFRIARESLANVRRHSGATAVRIVLTYNTSGSTMQISDNGRGLGLVDSADLDNHFGVMMMKEQAVACGGTLRVEEGRRGGVVVTALIPSLATAAEGHDSTHPLRDDDD